MEIINYSFPIFIKDLIISDEYISLVKNTKLSKFQFNKNNFFEKNDNNNFIQIFFCNRNINKIAYKSPLINS